MAVPGKKAADQFSASRNSMDSDEDHVVYCQPCDRDGPRLLAHGYCMNCSEHLCETCFTVHKKHTMSRHHTLLSKANMPQTMSLASQSLTDSLTKPCSKHNIEMIKFYCHDHKALLCSVCVTLEHIPTSCKVNYIPDVSDQVINSKEYHDMIKAIDDMTKEAYNTLQDMKKMNDISQKSLKDTLTDIQKFRTEVNQKIDEFEKQVEESAKCKIEENKRNIAKVETEYENLLKSMKASTEAIKHFNVAKQANELFIELKQAQKFIESNEQNVAILTELHLKRYRFEPTEALTDLLSNEKSLGTLKGTSLELKPRQLTLMDKICVATTKDRDSCFLTGMTTCPPNLLIVTDNYNASVKMIDVSKKSVLDQLFLIGYPWDVSTVSLNEIVVTIPNIKAIQFMSVSGNTLKEKHFISVDGQCRGISCRKDKMVVSFEKPVKVQILLIDGSVLQTIEDSFKFPRYVTTTDKCIYVSDRDMDTITKLGWQGEEKATYDRNCTPCGLITSGDRTVFVCYEDNTITEISENFTEDQTVVKDIVDPLALCWSAEAGALYTSSWTSDGERNYIKIFRPSC